MKTIGQYHQQNKCLEAEFKANIADLVEIYEITKLYNLETELSFDDMSIVPRKTDLPYPQLCITPYAFIKACISKVEQVETFIHKPFAPLFDFYNTKISELGLSDNKFFGMIEKKLNKGTKPFEEIVYVLNGNKDAGKEIEKNLYIQAIHKELQVPTLNLTTLKLDSKLGQGTYGTVCKVVTNQGEICALKQCTEENIPALYRESFVLHNLRHPNIVEFKGYCATTKNIIPEWVDETEHGFMLMEFCEHGDLEHYISNYHPEGYIPIETLTLLVGQLCASCLYIHSKRMVHRDLKLANILVKQVEPFPWIKLCDFGFARANDTVMMTTAGTPLTADPRILKGEGYTDKAELFSMGCIIYYLIYKRYPCQGCFDFEGIVNMIERKEVSYGCPMAKKEYQPFVDLAKMLLETNDRNQKKKDKEVYWRELTRNKCVKECLNAVEKAFQKQFGKK